MCLVFFSMQNDFFEYTCHSSSVNTLLHLYYKDLICGMELGHSDCLIFISQNVYSGWQMFPLILQWNVVYFGW